MITVILNCYKRLNYLNRQIEAIISQSISPKDIMVWYNKPEEGNMLNLNKITNHNIKVAYSDNNFKFHGRFAYGLLAKTEYVAFFDDDTIPGVDWFKNCMSYMKDNDYILGTSGVILNTDNNYYDNTKYGWNGIRSNSLEVVDLVGHAWFMRRNTLKYLWQQYPVSWDNGEDIQLSAFAYKYGKIITAVPPHVPNKKNNWGSLYGYLGEDQHSTWIHDKQHTDIRNQVCKDVIEMGYIKVKSR